MKVRKLNNLELFIHVHAYVKMIIMVSLSKFPLSSITQHCTAIGDCSILIQVTVKLYMYKKKGCSLIVLVLLSMTPIETYIYFLFRFIS